jgi:tripartite-type tricarboxylate transporter receptor subunit TctC
MGMVDVQKRLFDLGIVPDFLTPEAQDHRMRTDIDTWREVSKAANLTPR